MLALGLRSRAGSRCTARSCHRRAQLRPAALLSSIQDGWPLRGQALRRWRPVARERTLRCAAACRDSMSAARESQSNETERNSKHSPGDSRCTHPHRCGRLLTLELMPAS